VSRFADALPVLLGAGVLLAGLLLLGWRLRVLRPLSQLRRPLARFFLRGRRFRWSREEARGQLYRLAARATRGDDEEAARFLERAGLALWQGGAVVSEGALASVVGKTPGAAAAEELRQKDRAELERQARQDLADSAGCRARGEMLQAERRAAGPPAFPVFRDGQLVGHLLAHYAQKDQEGAVLAFANGAILTKRKTWVTSSPDALLATLPPHAFRVVVLLILMAVGLLVPGSATAADAPFPTYPATQLSQYQHKALRLRPGQLVCAVGFVESTRREKDGDLHVWVCSDPATLHWTMTQRRGSCVLGEIVPGHPLPRPAKGLQIKMCGKWVEEDLQHGWTEFHPVMGWCSPAASCEVRP